MITRLNAAEAAEARSLLIELPRDAVEGGASVGFPPPLAGGEADGYWCGVDTRQGDLSETRYHSLGDHPAGTIHAHARGANGALHATVFFYKELRDR